MAPARRPPPAGPGAPARRGQRPAAPRPEAGRRPAGLAGCWRSWVRSAALTARAVLKTAATSGASTTTLQPCANRAAYFPRTPPAKSYSARMSSRPRGGLAALIVSPFPLPRESSTDDPDGRPAVGVHDDDQPPGIGLADQDEPVLGDRVVGIVDRD